ncbi:MAG: archaeoflavoprotein AfpA [Candidatus Methanophagaceae archaeon]|nr:MAG: archaeoflavoprotein AfpA [Methanophagales archaeon]HDN68574.1 archaeoflavoprotein AfpA [Methanomicrobia archaeon]
MSKKEKVKVAWGVTGSGDRLTECVNFMKELAKRHNLEVHAYLSKEGETVLKYYNLLNEVRESFSKMSSEKGPNAPFLSGKLQLGKYDFVLIAPATANTVAKIAHGIADTLLTNSAAQAMKVAVPVYIFPVDQKEGEITTKLPNGRDLKLRIRKEDEENVEKLRRMRGITVLSRVEELEAVVRGF